VQFWWPLIPDVTLCHLWSERGAEIKMAATAASRKNQQPRCEHPLVTAVEVPRCLLPLQNHNPDAKIHVSEMATSGDNGGEDCGPWKKQSAEHCFELLVNCTFWVLSAAAAAAGAADAASAAQT